MEITFAIHPAFSGPRTVHVDTLGRPSGWKARIERLGPQFGIESESGYDPDSGSGMRERVLDPEECRSIQAALENAMLPVAARGAMGLDGVSYSLEVRSGFTCFRVEWWLHLPDEWETLRPLVEALSRL